MDNARDKHKTREVLEAAGLPSPRHHLIRSAADLDAAAQHVGFPAVIKPVSGAASIGVVRVDNVEQLRTSYASVVKEMKRARLVSGALVQVGRQRDKICL